MKKLSPGKKAAVVLAATMTAVVLLLVTLFFSVAPKRLNDRLLYARADLLLKMHCFASAASDYDDLLANRSGSALFQEEPVTESHRDAVAPTAQIQAKRLAALLLASDHTALRTAYTAYAAADTPEEYWGMLLNFYYLLTKYADDNTFSDSITQLKNEDWFFPQDAEKHLDATSFLYFCCAEFDPDPCDALFADLETQAQALEKNPESFFSDRRLNYLSVLLRNGYFKAFETAFLESFGDGKPMSLLDMQFLLNEIAQDESAKSAVYQALSILDKQISPTDYSKRGCIRTAKEVMFAPEADNTSDEEQGSR